MLDLKGASLQSRPYCMVKYHILQDVTLLVGNSTDKDQKVDKYTWWRAAIATSTKLESKGNDPGPVYLLSLIHI